MLNTDYSCLFCKQYWRYALVIKTKSNSISAIFGIRKCKTKSIVTSTNIAQYNHLTLHFGGQRGKLLDGVRGSLARLEPPTMQRSVSCVSWALQLQSYTLQQKCSQRSHAVLQACRKRWVWGSVVTQTVLGGLTSMIQLLISYIVYIILSYLFNPARA